MFISNQIQKHVDDRYGFAIATTSPILNALHLSSRLSINLQISPDFKKLIAPGKDAESLATVLQDPVVGDYEVKILLNESKNRIEEEIEIFFSDRKARRFTFTLLFLSWN